MSHIAIAGIGYVGLSLSVLLSQKNKVIAYEPNEEKGSLVNNRISPLDDKEIQDFLANKDLDLHVTSKKKK